MNIGLISVRCSSRVHVEALTSCYSCEKSENKINVHITTISENTIDHKRRVSRQRKRDREPSRISVKRILKGLKKRKCRKIIQSFVRRHLPKSSLICDLCKNYKTWNMWYTTDHFYCKFVFFMKSKKKCCKEHKHVQIVMNSNVVSFSQNHSRLMGGMTPKNAVNHDIPWNCLTERLRLIGLIPHDVGGSGDCFFKSVSHQLYGTADLHLEIRMAGISHLQNYPELYIESISDDSWNNYIQHMSKEGTWCDNIIMQAVANACNCVIHITQSNIHSPEGTILTPVAEQEGRKTIFIGYINELHYVSTMTDKNSQYKNKLRCIKRKLSETNEHRQKRLANHQEYMKKVKYGESHNQRASTLEHRRDAYKKRMCEETPEKRKERLSKKRDSYEKNMCEESPEKLKERLSKKRKSYQTKSETIFDVQKNTYAGPIHEQKIT